MLGFHSNSRPGWSFKRLCVDSTMAKKNVLTNNFSMNIQKENLDHIWAFYWLYWSKNTKRRILIGCVELEPFALCSLPCWISMQDFTWPDIKHSVIYISSSFSPTSFLYSVWQTGKVYNLMNNIWLPWQSY